MENIEKKLSEEFQKNSEFQKYLDLNKILVNSIKHPPTTYNDSEIEKILSLVGFEIEEQINSFYFGNLTLTIGKKPY